LNGNALPPGAALFRASHSYFNCKDAFSIYNHAPANFCASTKQRG